MYNVCLISAHIGLFKNKYEFRNFRVDKKSKTKKVMIFVKLLPVPMLVF